MSYCTVAEIGGAATIRHVEGAAQVIDDAFGENTLYSPSATWGVIRSLQRNPWTDDVVTGLGYHSLSVSEIEIYEYDRLLATATNPTVKGRFATVSVSKSVAEGRNYQMKVTGVRGVATLEDLSSGDDVEAGQSVVRGENVIFYLEDGTAMANDQLIVPPAVFNSAAISVGRRIMTLEQDQQSMFDDSSYQRENRLLDGWRSQLEKYLRG